MNHTIFDSKKYSSLMKILAHQVVQFFGVQLVDFNIRR